MEPVLIITDTERIQAEKDLCDASVVFIQGFYDLIAALGITFTIEELVANASAIINPGHRTGQMLERNIKEKLLAKVSGANFNGVPLSEDALEKLIAQPDVSHLYSYVRQNYPKFYVADRIGITPSFLELNDGVINKKATAFTTIEALYTYYTKNDKGAELATLMFLVCDKLNEYETYLETNKNHVSYRSVKEVKGIDYINYVYRPNLQFIRDVENLYSDYVVV
jgi:hypothetical protein